MKNSMLRLGIFLVASILVVLILIAAVRLFSCHPPPRDPANAEPTTPPADQALATVTAAPAPGIRVYTSPDRTRKTFGNNLVAAVSNAAPGETIAIGPGSYTFDITLRPAANVNIVGAGSDETRLVYRGSNVAFIVGSGFVLFQKIHLTADHAAQLINCDGHSAYLLSCRLSNDSGLALYAEGTDVTAASSDIIGGIDVATAGFLKIQDTRYDRNRTRGPVEERMLAPRTGCLLDNWTFAEGGKGRWRAGPGWTIADGAATWNAAAGGKDGNLAQGIKMNPGRRYSLIWKVSGSSGVFLERTIRLGGQSMDFTHTGDGVFAKKFTASAADPVHIYAEPGPNAPTSMKLDFVFLQELDDARPDNALPADKVIQLDAKSGK